MAQLNGKGPENLGRSFGRGLGKCNGANDAASVEKLGVGMGKRRKANGGVGFGKRLNSGANTK